MTESASRIVWEAHGSPTREDCEDASGRCWVCAAPMLRGQPIKKWNGVSFTGQNKIRCPSATHVCEPCVHICSRIAPVLGRPAKEGKSFGGNFRNYSTLYEYGWPGVPFGESQAVASYANASKGDKPLIREFLGRVHDGAWFAAIADSGQKHLLPWVPINPVGGSRAGYVLFDEETIAIPEDQSLLHNVGDLLTSGVTKEEIQRGEYRPRVLLDNRDAIEHFEFHHGGERGGGWFELSVWLAQRNEEQHAEQKRTRDAKKVAQTKRGAAAELRRHASATANGGSREISSESRPDSRGQLLLELARR